MLPIPRSSKDKGPHYALKRLPDFSGCMPVGAVLLFLLSGILSTAVAQGQGREYVINGGFETMNSCPIEPGEITLATGWHGNEGTPDYLHTCSKQPRDSADILGNYVGYRNAYEGRGQAGLYLLRYSKERKEKENYATHELIYTKLRQPLTVGKAYRVRFYLSLADSSFIGSDSIYVSFSTEPTFNKQHQLVDPHFTKGVALANQHHWQLYELDITATEPFTYCYLGLPRKKITRKAYETIITNGLQQGKVLRQHALIAYYFLDNVSLIERE